MNWEIIYNCINCMSGWYKFYVVIKIIKNIYIIFNWYILYNIVKNIFMIYFSLFYLI